MKYLVGFLLSLITRAQPAEVIVGTDTTYWRQPFEVAYNYNTHEVIYRQSEINVAGLITHLGFLQIPRICRY
ncbi:MAG: hypothetical protein N2748_04170 [candidate division WOR-3 bacterium]|nr:hypothetical protein [candidate division WOR-3 bacterium]